MALHHATTLQDDDLDATQAPDPCLTEITALNQKHAFVMIGGKAMVMNFEHDPSQGETLTFRSQADFRARYANRSRLVLCEDGTRLAPLAEQWWSHPQRREYAGLVFMPGHPQEVTLRHGDVYYNLFRGWPVQPVPGDCSLFWAHLKNIICAGDEEGYRYVRRGMPSISRPRCPKLPWCCAVARSPARGRWSISTASSSGPTSRPSARWSNCSASSTPT